MTNPSTPPTTNPGPPPQTSSTQVIEFPSSATLLGGLALGSDGNVYFSTTTEIGVFSPKTGRYTLTASRVPDTWPVIPTLQPRGAVASADGVVSAIAMNDTSSPAPQQAMTADTFCCTPALVRLTIANGSFTENYGPPNDVFEDVTMTPDGTPWVTANQPTPAGLLGFIYTTKAGCSTALLPDAINSITLGADGFIWLASDPQLNNTTESQIFRVDPSNGNVVHTYRLGTGSLVTGLTAGPDGALWFTDQGLNEIGRLGSDGTISYFSIPTAASGLAAITTGCDGALWFTEQQANKIGRITTAGKVSEYAVPTPNAGVGDIAGCLGGAIFFTEKHAIGEVVVKP